jgi:hypothetical protein
LIGRLPSFARDLPLASRRPNPNALNGQGTRDFDGKTSRFSREIPGSRQFRTEWFIVPRKNAWFSRPVGTQEPPTRQKDACYIPRHVIRTFDHGLF